MKQLPVITITDTSNLETKPDNASKRRMTLSELVSFADLPKAKKFREESGLRILNKNSNYEEYPVCSTSLKTLGKYGVGLELYFLLIKQLTILFLVISIISAWPMYENLKGGGLGSLYQGQLYSYFSVANVASFQYEKDLKKAEKLIEPLQSTVLNLSLADGIYSLMFLAFVLQYNYVSKKVSQNNQIDNVTAGDYAIEVKGFPLKNIKLAKISTHFSRYGELAEVSLARKYNGRLNEFKKRAQISYKLGLKRLIAKKQKRRRGTITVLEQAQVEFDEKMGRDDMFSDKTNDELPVIRAYIIFERLEDRMKCLNDYRKQNKCCWRRRKQADHLMFKKKYPLLVKAATEPSDILWENLEVSHFQRVQRRILGVLILVPIIIASIVIVYAIKSYTNTLPKTADCKSLNINGNLPPDEAKLTYTTQESLFCFCQQQNLYTLAKSSELNRVCSEYLIKQAMLSLARFLGSSGVIFINIILKFIIAKLSQFERTSTETKQKLQNMTRVFVALFINTSIITLLVNADLQDKNFIKLIPYSQYVLHGNYQDFERNWYTDVGSLVTATMIVNAISPHYLNLLIWYPLGCLWRKLCWKCYKTQVSLNEMFAGPEFNIAIRTSQILTTIFSCYLYSGGMPILNVICFLTLFSIYWIDKTLILRHYKKPPFYSSAINDRLVYFLPFCIVFHCSFSLYAYGASDIFPSSVYQIDPGSYVFPRTVEISERVYRQSGIINLILVVLCLLFFTLKLFSFTVCRKKTSAVMDEAGINQGTYSMELGKIKAQGLHSYNIMENGTYKPLVISLNSAADKVAKLRNKQPPPSPVSVDLDEEYEVRHSRNENNNVLIPL